MSALVYYRKFSDTFPFTAQNSMLQNEIIHTHNTKRNILNIGYTRLWINCTQIYLLPNWHINIENVISLAHKPGKHTGHLGYLPDVEESDWVNSVLKIQGSAPGNLVPCLDLADSKQSETLYVRLALIIFTLPDEPRKKSFIMSNWVDNFATYLERLSLLPAAETAQSSVQLLRIHATAYR